MSRRSTRQTRLALSYACPDRDCRAAKGESCVGKRTKRPVARIHELRKDRVKRPWWYEQKEKEEQKAEAERQERREKLREERNKQNEIDRQNRKERQTLRAKARNEKGSYSDGGVQFTFCTKCGERMILRKKRDDGSEFWGCRLFPNCKGTKSTKKVAEENVDLDVIRRKKPETETEKPEQKPEEQKPVDPVKRIAEIIRIARETAKKHGMTLPIGYRTTRQLAQLTRVLGGKRVDDAFRLWVDGRVAKTERDKFDQAGLPAGRFKHPVTAAGGNPGWYETLELVMDEGIPIMLVGEAGSGKTRFVQWYAEKAKQRLHTIVGSGDVAGRELWVARRDVQKGQVTNVPGPAALAAKEGGILLLDEVDGFDANSLLPLNAPLNGDKKLSVPVLGEIEVHDDMKIVAAANTNGRSKDRSYAGRNRLDGAFLNRFAVVVRVEFDELIDEKVAREILEAELKKEKKPEAKKPEAKKTKISKKKTTKKRSN